MDAGAGHQVLIVEDDPHLGRQLQEMLRFLGFRADVAPTGPEGVSRFRAEPSDMVICDLMLPGLNGVQTIEEIRRLPLGGRVPVFLMSAVYRNPRQFEPELRRLRVLEFIPKPFSVIDVGRRIAAVLTSSADGRDAPSISETGSWRLSDLGIALGERSDAFERVGAFRRASLMQVLVGIFRGHAGGELAIYRAKTARRVFFLNGYPVGAESDDKSDGVGAVLRRAGWLPAEALRAAEARALESDRSLQAQLLHDGLVTERRLAVTERDRVRQIVVGSFAWTQGNYEFTPGDDFAQVRTIFEVNPVRCMGEAALKHLSTNEIAQETYEEAGRSLRPTSRFRRLFPYLDLPPGLEDLGTALAEQVTIQDLFLRFPSHTESLLKLLWLMKQLEMVESATPSAEPPRVPAAARVVVSPVTSHALRPVPGPGEPALEEQGRAVLHDYLCAVPGDAWALLGLRPGAPRAEVDLAISSRRQRWSLDTLPSSAPSEVRTKAKELLLRLDEVAGTLLSGTATKEVGALPPAAAVACEKGIRRWREAPTDPKAQLDARGLFEIAATLAPRHPGPWQHLAELCDAVADQPGAQHAESKVRELAPDLPWLLDRRPR